MNKDSNVVLLIFLLIGLIFGGLIGEYFGKYVEILAYSKSIGINSFNIDLSIVKMSLNFKMNLNLASVIGLAISIFLYRKL